MKKFVILFSALIIFLSINVSATAYDTIYVDEEAVISGDGGTAQTPLKSLHTALLQVNNNGKLIVKNTALLKLQPGEINEGVR
ncbi:MAG: hypothetical protein RSC29_07540, partial [Oscillospiraceae bacterium]